MGKLDGVRVRIKSVPPSDGKVECSRCDATGRIHGVVGTKHRECGYCGGTGRAAK